jgi:hypothetical protein
MKKIVKKLLLASLFFSAAIIPTEAHANFFSWDIFRNKTTKIGNTATNFLITNSRKTFYLLQKYPDTIPVLFLILFKIRINEPKQYTFNIQPSLSRVSALESIEFY